MMPENSFYFAYGSNMSSARLRARIPGASSLGRAWLADRQLVFNKPSADGSGKANLSCQPGARSWGVVYRLAPADWTRLDDYEPGYARVTCRVVRDGGRRLTAQTYVFESTGGEIQPFDWYLALLLAGAREHDLPRAYVETLRAVSTSVAESPECF